MGREYVSKYFSSLVINRVPSPSLLLFGWHKAPHLIHFCRFYSHHHHRLLIGLALLQQSPIYLFEVRRLFFSVSITVLVLIPSTRAVSRMPLPFIAISLICCFTSFNRPRSLNCKRKDFLEQAAFRQQYRCLPAALRPCLTTSTLWQSGQQIGSTTILPFPIFRDLYIRLHSCTNPHVHNTTAHS